MRDGGVGKAENNPPSCRNMRREGIGAPRPMFRHDGRIGRVENTLRRVETRDGGLRSPPTRVSTQGRGKWGWKIPSVMLKREMGGIGVPRPVFQYGGGLKIPSVASKHEMEGSEVPRLVF